MGDLKYSFNGNLSTIKNEILDLASDSLTRGGVHNVSPITLTRIGGSISEFWGYETNGLYTLDDCVRDASGNYVIDARGRYTVINEYGDTLSPGSKQPGDFRFVDIDGDSTFLENDDKVMLGSPIPKLTFGFSINLEYKGFDFAAQFSGTIGNKIFNGTKQYLYYYQDETNRCADFANRYVVDDIYKNDPYTGEPVLVLAANHDTEIPRNWSTNYQYPSDFFIEDGSYLRLRNITLGYTLPASLTTRVNVEKFRIYVGARNLKTWTKYTGINPEVIKANYDNGNDGEAGSAQILTMGIDDTIYPVTKMFLFGVNLTF